MAVYDVGPEQRKIVGMMAITGVVGTIGTIVAPPKNAQGQPQPGSVSPFRVILGVSIGSALLVVLSELGEVGAQLAMGLATLAAGSAILIKGGPVFTAILNAVGGSVGGKGVPTGSSPVVPGASTTYPAVPGGAASFQTGPGTYAPITGTIPT